MYVFFVLLSALLSKAVGKYVPGCYVSSNITQMLKQIEQPTDTVETR